MGSSAAYQRLRHTPPQLPPHRGRPRTNLMITSSNIAPIAASTISVTMPEPRWIPSSGNAPAGNEGSHYSHDEIADQAQARTLDHLARQPAAMPTANMTRRLSPDMFISSAKMNRPDRGWILCKIDQMPVV